MRVRLGSYNVENLFNRARAMNLESWADGKPALDAFAAFSKLLGKITYTAADKRRMLELIEKLGLRKQDKGPFVILRQNRGNLLSRHKDGTISIVADGRAGWSGSLELLNEPVDDQAMRNTARVIRDVGADILAVVEAENRPSLAAYNKEILKAVGGTPYRHVMLIDGNDERGIDVGLMTRETFEVRGMRSHVDDRLANGSEVFSRDCPEFDIALPGGERIVVLVNHFKSKGYGAKAASDARRQAQAARVAEIYERLRGEGVTLVAVVGDFNDTPDSAPLKPLLKQTDLADIATLPGFANGGFPGTYDTSSASKKIDYILLSPALKQRATGAGVFRKGVWSASRRWEMYAELTGPVHAASDHAALWVDLDL